ncbi:MAG: exodeoxyribonuclease VII large subunit [Candidatus Eisenbacteria bacterium]|uniref:Exodeoxyribonuclease 7 large subunit n=1 Tax=Eiseniibacteriota bacterium TaxID=2212470 RepID=A0A538T342_UNCEI|nr:MAG: exodeoxyribonuclease VII large subunit [Candidatus Eisenbacteria bacterium]
MNPRGRVLPLPAPGRPDRVFTVSELTQGIKNLLEDRFGVVLVQGEVTGLRKHTSGHVYFSLKDELSEIRVVLFASQAAPARDALQDGIAVQVEGEVTVYPKQGNYQIRALRVEPVGYGALQARFEALKRKLQAEGLFAPERKRSLPRYPTRIGIVTSVSGAALQDMVRVIRTRAPYASITVVDTRVQGDGAAQEIAAALGRMNAWGLVDVIVVGRGGGSPQDLWAFNEEAVVRAIVASRIPVVSAVGHEVDFTLADLAADLRVATPSHAGQEILKDLEDIRRTLLDMSRHALNRILGQIGQARTHLRALEHHHALKRPERRIQEGLQSLDQYQDRFSRALSGWVISRRRRTEVLTERLRSHAPSRSFARARDRIEAIRRRALQTVTSRLSRQRERIQSQARLLDSFDHHRVLERGYALVWSEGQGILLKRGAGLRESDPIEVQFYDARAGARVTRVEPYAPGADEETP